MKHADWITNTYKQHNEDACGLTENAAWVMDGALPLNKTQVTSAPNDVVWMVDWWTHYLNRSLSNIDDSIHSILTSGIHAINRDFSRFADPKSLSKLDRASAGIGIVRSNDMDLECYVLGDIEIVLRLKNGNHKVITDTKIEALDSEVIKMIASTPDRSSQIVFNGYTQAELDKLQRNRMSMNTKTGYAILEHDISAVPRGIYYTFPKSEVYAILIMSDGYSALYNKFDHCSLEGLFDAVDTLGVDGLIPTLRQIEQNGFDTHKRLRKHDDATAVYLQL